MVSCLVLNSTEIKPPCFLLIHKMYPFEAVVKHSCDDYRKEIATQTTQD